MLQRQMCHNRPYANGQRTQAQRPIPVGLGLGALCRIATRNQCVERITRPGTLVDSALTPARSRESRPASKGRGLLTAATAQDKGLRAACPALVANPPVPPPVRPAAPVNAASLGYKFAGRANLHAETPFGRARAILATAAGQAMSAEELVAATGLRGPHSARTVRRRMGLGPFPRPPKPEPKPAGRAVKVDCAIETVFYTPKRQPGENDPSYRLRCARSGFGRPGKIICLPSSGSTPSRRAAEERSAFLGDRAARLALGPFAD
jgi:hypothetical protein